MEWNYWLKLVNKVNCEKKLIYFYIIEYKRQCMCYLIVLKKDDKIT